MGSRLFSVFTILFVLACVAFLAYIVTKFVGKKSMGAMKSKYMKVVDALSIGFDKTIYLVAVGEEYVLLSSSAKGFEFLCNLSSPINLASEQINTQDNEKKSFSKYFDFFRPVSDKSHNTEDENAINNNIDKLRDMFNNKKK